MKMNNEKVQEAFAQLRPLCVTLTKEHTIENVKLVQNCLVNTDADTFQGLQEYILFPLRLILKQSAKSDENLYEQVVCCMCFILERTEVQGSSMFLDIFNTLCLLVTRTSTPGQVSSVSEELKLAVIKSLSALLKSAATQTLEEVYQPSFLPALGHVVTLMIQMVDRETNRDLRVASLACLMDVSLVNRKTSGMLTRSLSNLFASFVPGVSMGLCKVITGDTKQGQKITVTAIEAWHKIISLVMSDQNNKAPKTSSENKKSDNKEISSKYAELVVTKSEEWVKNTADKLKILIQKINEVKSHSNWRVRMAMVEWSSSLLMNCSKSLESCIPDFLEVLVSLVGDDYPNVASKSRESLKKFTTSESSHTKTLTEILEDNLHTMATQLPRLIRTADEETKLSTIKLFNGYIQLLGASVNKMLSSSAHLQRVSLALLQVLELDCSSVTIIQEKTQGESFSTLELGHLYNSPKKCFKLFTDSNIYTCLMTTCRMLGYYGDPDVLFDHFIDLFHQYKIHRKQSILVLCHLCEGILQLDTTLTGLPKHHCDKAEVEPLIRSLLDIFLSPEHLDLPTTLRSSDHNKGIFLPDNHGLDLQIVSSKAPMSSSLLEVNSNVLQICLLLEAIGICIQVLGKDYEYLMMDVLYPVLEKIGSENTAVSQTAYITLSSVARSCQYSCIEDLLRANADYLVNCLSLRMRHLDRNPQAPQVLSVILQHSGERILPLVEDTIRDVMEGLDSYYEEVGLMFMKVLHTLTLCIKKWYPPTSQDSKVEDKASSSGKPVKTAEDIKLYLLGYLHQKKIAEGIDTDADEDLNITTEADKEAEDIEDFDDTKVEPPYHVQKLKQVLERCVHQMSAPDPRVRLVTMETVIQGLLALKPHETELLPLVHKLWAPFTQRLRDEEMVVILKACSVLQIFAEVSKDFIRQRLIKDVFPKLTDFLNKQASISLKAGPVYHHSMACKLQGRILQDLGQLCRHVGVGENHLTKVITATLPYLSCRQPGLLQNACVTTLQQLCELEPDTVWLLLNELYCDLTPTPPHPHFPLVQLQAKVSVPKVPESRPQDRRF